MLCIPRGMCFYVEGAETIPDVVENLRKGITLGGMEPFSSIVRPVQDDSKPTVPFMVMENQQNSSHNRRYKTSKDTGETA